ncbi:MAG: hypothetical protein QNI87_04095 [Erythrobacter sp.]|uniref:hypothetical protein n=1 Tax=Erythrobacter sp. TaxID=1042 RepID=UPI0026261E82|nr:hypothetical protein [Erythrobacter sp.]MDJ0977695.1 hypothetical protein [Erythrobacter sp.]
MRAVLIPVLAFACMGASDEAGVEIPQPDESALFGEYQEKLEALKKRNLAAEPNEGSLTRLLQRSACRDRLERAQEDAQKPLLVQPRPLLRRGPDTPEQPPLAIYAVDRRENGCGMMVMMGNPEDVRPVPVFNAEDHRLMPANADPED